MKKKYLIYIGTGLTLLLLMVIFWDPVIDFLPIDQSGWLMTDGQYVYLDEDGDPVTGWQELNGKIYYMDPETGVMRTGWQEQDGKCYYLDPETGVMRTGWLEADGQRYYLNADGNPVCGLFEAEGQHYYGDTQGRLRKGWLELSGNRYYFDEDYTMRTGWLELDNGTYYLNAAGIMETGWVDVEESRYYLDESGLCGSGWLKTDQGLFYLEQDGRMYTGWLELDGKRYYLTDDGTAAKGIYKIGEQTCFFTASGVNFLMVNRWNPVPEGYTTELKAVTDEILIAEECYDSLVRMLQDCTAAGFDPVLVDGYRSNETQQALFQERVSMYLSWGYDPDTAFYLTGSGVADPGTSEHELGLAMDIGDAYEDTSDIHPGHTLYWLSEHCWEYGWILRYPGEKSHITGIMYEPWHFRYVGVELAMELRNSGLCLEEYLDALSDNGTTCGNPEA